MSMLSVAKEAGGIESLSDAIGVVEIAAGNAKKSISGLWKAFTSSPLAMVTAVALAAGAAFVYFGNSAKRATEEMDEAFSKYDSIKSKIESINTELESTQNRIDELNAKGGLTLVEKKELAKLEKANKELKRQKEILLLEESHAARAAATSARNAYRENFKYEISDEMTDKYRASRAPVGNLEGHTRGDPTNISAQIDNIEKWTKQRDSFAKTSESWDEYNQKIEEGTANIWKQVGVLEDYKAKLEAIPEADRNIFDDATIADITDDLDYIYHELDRDTWKQWKLDDAFDSDTMSAAKKDLIDIAKESNNVGISVEDVEKKYGALAKSIGNAYQEDGVFSQDLYDEALQDFVDAINSEAGIIDFSNIKKQLSKDFLPDISATYEGKKFKEEFNDWIEQDLSEDDLKLLYEISLDTDTATWELEDWKSALEYAKANYSTFTIDISFESDRLSNIQSAISESMAGTTGLSSESISAISSAFADLEDYDPSKLFENTANGIHLNEEALKALESQYESTKKADMAAEMTRLQDEYEATRLKLLELGEGHEDYAATLNNLNGYEAQIENLAQMQAQYEGLTSAYNKWVTAQSGGNERDSYEAIGKSYESMKAILDQGWYGDESLNAYLDLMLNVKDRTGDALQDFAKLDDTIAGTSHSLMDYWKFDKDGNLVTDGLFDFLKDVQNVMGEDYVWLEDGKFNFDFKGEKLDKLTEWLKTSPELIDKFEQAMIDAGFAVDMGVETAYTSLAEKLSKLQVDGLISSDIDIGVNLKTDELEDIKTTIDQLKADRIKIDAETNPEAALELDAIIAKCEQAYYVRLNMATDGGLDQAASILDRIHDKTVNVGVVTENEAEVTELAGELANLPKEVQIAIGVEEGNVGNAEGIVSQLKTDIGSVEIPATFKPKDDATAEIDKVNNQKIDDKDFNINANDNATATINSIKSNNIADKHFTIYEHTVRTTSGGGSSTHTSSSGNTHGGGGTKFAEGTAITNGHALASGTAFARGNWGTKGSGVALVGEEGPELRVTKNGNWELIGEDSAEFRTYEPGQIIFNANQTREIFKYGKIKHGAKRGRALASGTALASGVAFGSGSGGTMRPGYGVGTSSPGGSSSSSSSRPSSSSSNKSNSSSDKEETFEKVDWIEIAIDRIERIIENFARTAESTFKTLGKRLIATSDQIESIKDEIYTQELAANRYLKEAASVGLGELEKNVQNGTIDINSYDESTREKISEYQEW